VPTNTPAANFSGERDLAAKSWEPRPWETFAAIFSLARAGLHAGHRDERAAIHARGSLSELAWLKEWDMPR
jgi:hypothetical protein